VTSSRSDYEGVADDPILFDPSLHPVDRWLRIPNMSTVIPKMGRTQAREKRTGVATRSIADALFSRTQQRVFSLMFGQPERAFATSENTSCSSEANMPSPQLDNLVRIGRTNLDYYVVEYASSTNPPRSGSSGCCWW
jgi:hypothetical protein